MRKTKNFEEITACLLCESEERSLRFHDGPFQVVQCSHCQLVYVTPRLRADVLPHVYGESYWRSPSPKSRGYADYVGDEALYLTTYEKRFRLVNRFAPTPGRALDIGCAAGFFLKVLSRHGWQVDGVELSPEIARHAQEVYGFDQVHVGELGTSSFEPDSFDLITCWDLVEHVPDPIRLLQKARSLLKADGYLIIETQNVDSRFARLLGRRWQHYKHLEHLYHFSASTLRLLLKKSGLDLVHQTSRFGGKHVSLGFIRERATRIHPAMETLLRPLSLLKEFHLYVNVYDELIVVTKRSRDFVQTTNEGSDSEWS
jgi:2-polyprenyl-3-methyl-5-hydroxy-6-metoxy-1,4-benzoquinol methylase